MSKHRRAISAKVLPIRSVKGRLAGGGAPGPAIVSAIIEVDCVTAEKSITKIKRAGTKAAVETVEPLSDNKLRQTRSDPGEDGLHDKLLRALADAENARKPAADARRKGREEGVVIVSTDSRDEQALP